LSKSRLKAGLTTLVIVPAHFENMKKQITALTLCAAAIVTFSIPAFAWDDVGHKITSYIAWQRLSPQARENVIRVLRAAPEDSHLSALYMQYGAEPEEVRKREFFEIAATWADIVRDRAFENRYKKYHHSNWHYDDFFWRQVEGKVAIVDAPDDGGQAVRRLEEFEKTIRSASESDREKAIATAWIMHLTGDLHQPLHTSARVTDVEPKGDQGGNLFLLTPQGTPREKQLNLHWFWDSIVVRNTPLKGETCDRDFVEGMARSIMKKHPYERLQSRIQLGRYESWKKESFDLAPTQVFSPDLKRFQEPSAQYRRNALRVAEQQLALAGYRLGETLNSVFSNAPAKPAR